MDVGHGRKSFESASLGNKFHEVAGSRPQMGHNVPCYITWVSPVVCPPPPSYPHSLLLLLLLLLGGVLSLRFKMAALQQNNLFSKHQTKAAICRGPAPTPPTSHRSRKKISSHFVTPPTSHLPHSPFVKRPKKEGEKNIKVKQEEKKKKHLLIFFSPFLFCSPFSIFSKPQ